jgi:hypothetical protein
MAGSAFDEGGFFAALHDGGARVLLIGRRALIALGAPVLTADYDLWVHIDDIERLNVAVAPFDLLPSSPPEVARARGRYVLENDEHVDVLVARRQSTKDGEVVTFDDVWARRRIERYRGGSAIAVPSIEDLIRTKKWSLRQKDIADIQMLEGLLRRKETPE